MSQNSETGTRPLTHDMHFEIMLAQGELSRAMNLEKRQFSKQRRSLINTA